MGYMHIENLYKNQEILIFKECYAMEKIHGTSAHISWKNQKLSFFSGGVEHLSFLNIFDHEDLTAKFLQLGIDDIIIFGEAYGGKCQRMSHVYGKDLRFIAFEVRISESWLSVPDSEGIVNSLGLDFVSYVRCSTDIEELNKQRDTPSVQAVKNGIALPQKREGVVLRPIIELRKNNGQRIIAKYKGEEFSETKTPRDITDDELQILDQAQSIADEWVTEMRLTHVLDNFPTADISQTGDIIKAMIEDVERESDGEIIKSKKARAAIGKKTATLFKSRLNNLII